MLYSQYNYTFRSKDGKYYVYNSETNAFAELDEITYEVLIKLKKGDNPNLETLSTQVIDDLISAKIIVDEKTHNNFYYEKKLHYYFNSFNRNSLGFAVAPTTFCNFNCHYCYEENRKPIFMTEETEKNFINFIKKHENVKFVDINWYGGEPLTHFNSIKNILKLIKDDDKIKLRNHGVVTNGYLLDEKKSLFFVDNPLNFIQVTIDGDRETHNKRRILTSGEGTYDMILSNIDVFLKLNPHTRVQIRVNIDITNYEQFFRIYTELNERWLNYNVSVYPAFVQDYSESCSHSCSIMQHQDRMNFYINLFKEHKFDVQFFPKLEIGGCGATNVNYYVVGPKGELYKCWNDIGNNDRIVGYLDNDNVPNLNILAKYLVGPTMFDEKECKECNLFPICTGGCQYMRLENKFNNKKFDLCTNRKNYMENVLELHLEKLNNNKKSSTLPNNN